MEKPFHDIFFDLTINNLVEIKNNFLDELISAYQGKTSSLPFLKNTLPKSSFNTIKDQTIQVMVIGGTIYKKSLVNIKNNQLNIISSEEKTLPILDSLETLMDLLSNNIDPKINNIVLNFAFPLLPIIKANNRLDGILLGPAKSHALTGLIKKTVGTTFEEYVSNKTNRQIQVSCLNDSISLCLFAQMNSSWVKTVAGIIGTGVNFAFFLDQNTIISLESGNFNKFSPSSYLEQENKLFPLVIKPSLFEQEISGHYLYRHYNYLIKIYSSSSLSINSTEELTKIAYSNNNLQSKIAQQLFYRSAALVSCQIAAIYEFKKQDKLFLTMQGSVFNNGWHYKELIVDYINQLNLKNKIIFNSNVNTDILGAASLLLPIKKYSD